MPKGFTEEEKSWIRERLLGEGEKLFSAYGLKKTTIAELARAAKISTGAFYQFYESKEALFMELMEMAEERGRQEIFAAVERPGPSPRARLYAVLKMAFGLLETIPMLQLITGGDYDLLFRRIAPETLQEHMATDRDFLEELVTRCRDAGIPVQADPDQIASLVYPLVLAAIHRDDFGRIDFDRGIDRYLEMIAAYCLGEVELQLQDSPPARPRAQQSDSL